MTNSSHSIVRVATLAIILLLAPFSVAAAGQPPTDDAIGIKNFLTENTLVYPDAQGEENLIHFGRFGNFDWYFPCRFESGSWSLDRDLVLSLTYDNPDFQPRKYRLARREGEISLIEPDTGNVTPAKLLEGSHIPFF